MQHAYVTDTLDFSKDIAPIAYMEALAERLECGFWVIPNDESGRQFEIFLCNSTFEDDGDEIGVLTVFEPSDSLYVVFVLCLEIRFDDAEQVVDYGWHLQFESEVQGGEGEEAFQTATDLMNLTTEEMSEAVDDCLQTIRSLAGLPGQELVIALPPVS